MIATLWLVVSLAGQLALAVPLTPCGPCGQQMPADHQCPINSEAGPAPTKPSEPASDPHERNHTS